MWSLYIKMIHLFFKKENCHTIMKYGVWYAKHFITDANIHIPPNITFVFLQCIVPLWAIFVFLSFEVGNVWYSLTGFSSLHTVCLSFSVSRFEKFSCFITGLNVRPAPTPTITTKPPNTTYVHLHDSVSISSYDMGLKISVPAEENIIRIIFIDNRAECHNTDMGGNCIPVI